MLSDAFPAEPIRHWSAGVGDIYVGGAPIMGLVASPSLVVRSGWATPQRRWTRLRPIRDEGLWELNPLIHMRTSHKKFAIQSYTAHLVLMIRTPSLRSANQLP